MHFMVGLLAYLMAGADTMRLIASSRLSASSDGDNDAVLPRLVRFIEAGMRAPVDGSFDATVAQPVSGVHV